MSRWKGIVAAAAFGASCASVPQAAPAGEDGDEPVLLGPLSRQRIESELPDWVEAQITAQPDLAAAVRLAEIGGPEVEVTVYLGTWCDDSRRELARLWRAVDLAGGSLPFDLTYLGVDREKRRPASVVAGARLDYLPTFVVRRGGEELGRIVEQSPGGIEADLAALVAGERSGVVSARTDLGEG